MFARENRENPAADKSLQETNRLLRAIFDHTHALVACLDADFNFVLVNRAYAHADGREPDFFPGKNHFDLYPHEENEAIFRRVVATGEPFFVHARPFVYKQNPERGVSYWDWNLMPIKDAAETVTGLVFTLIDVTEQQRAEQALRAGEEMLAKAKEAAEAANRTKSQFMANLSHELRTPMNAVLGMIDLALGDAIPPTVRDYLQTAKDSAEGLLELLNDLLDFSRMEASRLELELVPFSLRKMLQQTLRGLGARAYEKGLELVCDIDDDVPDALVGDPLRLRQVLSNLAGNAVKFTHQGEVVVRVGVAGDEGGEEKAERRRRKAEEWAASAGAGPLVQSLIPNPQSLPSGSCSVLLRFSITDTGIGILPEQQQRIFEPFVQADASTTRRYGGTGLGLAICAGLVARMGGEISLKSQPGQGSIFTFTARFRLQSGPSEQSAAAAPDGDELRGLRVLVVDDNLTSRRILRQMLLRMGMQSEAVADVPAALAKIHEAAAAGQPFSLAVIDAMLPGIDGLTLATWIKNNPRLAEASVLLLSAADRHDCAERLEELVAVCVEKPVAQANLLTAIVRALGKREPAAGAPTASPPPGQSVATAPTAGGSAFRLDEALAQCHDEQMFRDMVGYFFSDALGLLEEIRTAVGRQQAEEAARAAHRLRGTLAYLGARPSLRAAEEVEKAGLAGDLAALNAAAAQLAVQLASLSEALEAHRPEEGLGIGD